MKKLPKQQRSKIVVDAVLEATTRILSKIRLQEATTNKIADTAGVGIGSLYDYFPNKSSIAVALIDKHFQDSVDDFRNLLFTEKRELRAVIDDCTDLIATKYLGRHHFLREIFLLAPANGRVEVLFEKRAQIIQMLADYLVREHQKPIEWAQKKSFVTLNAVLGVVENFIILEDSTVSAKEITSELRTLMHLILEVTPVRNQSYSDSQQPEGRLT